MFRSLAKIRTLISRRGLTDGLRDAAARWAQNRLRVPSDILGQYEWVLTKDRPAERPAPSVGSLKINWIVPDIAEGSGGLLNIFRAIHYLEKYGHTNRIYTLGKWSASGQYNRELVRRHYFPVEAPIEGFAGNVADSDALVATNWQTAYAVRGLGNTAGKFYFVQDLEDRFHAEGSLAEFARETYRWGFRGLTLGLWIAEVLGREFSMPCSPFGFSYDREIYSCNGRARHNGDKKRVLFYARPNTERRGFELGVLALSLVAMQMPNTEFVLVGFPPRTIQLPFSAVLPGILTPKELADLYRRCDVALVLSHTNLSMLPLELMACGCAVVSNSGRNVEWLLSEETTQRARATPRALAEAVLELLKDDQLRLKKAAAGQAFAEGTDWGAEIKRIEAAFYQCFVKTAQAEQLKLQEAHH